MPEPIIPQGNGVPSGGNSQVKAGQLSRLSFKDLDPYLKALVGLLALIVPSIAAVLAFTYAVHNLQQETHDRTCALLIKVNIARAVNDYFELTEEKRRLDNAGLADTEEERTRIEADKKALDTKLETVKKRRAWYEGAEKNVWKGNCAELEMQALRL